jgi:hypothetical protein
MIDLTEMPKQLKMFFDTNKKGFLRRESVGN